jgi:hypothetical protein
MSQQPVRSKRRNVRLKTGLFFRTEQNKTEQKKTTPDRSAKNVDWRHGIPVNITKSMISTNRRLTLDPRCSCCRNIKLKWSQDFNDDLKF